jgi:hypothetical protein
MTTIGAEPIAFADCDIMSVQVGPQKVANTVDSYIELAIGAELDRQLAAISITDLHESGVCRSG